jgi:zinc transport system substrate-binding protein
MKKQMFVLITLVSLISVSCGKKESSNHNKIILSSFYPVYIIALNVADGIPGVSVQNMTPPITGCLHDYSLSTEDMIKLEKASIFLVNGAGMESFIEKAAKSNSSLKICELSKNIDLIGSGKDRNPHVWVSVSNVITMTKNCASYLSEADPKNSLIYTKNAEAYIKKLSSLKTEMDKSLKPYNGSKIVTFHEAFPYFAKEYEFNIVAVIEHEPGSEPSAKEIADTIRIVNKSGVKALFAEPQYPSSSAEIISKETGVLLYNLDPAVTGSETKNAYINIMRKNKDVLVKALSK